MTEAYYLSMVFICLTTFIFGIIPAVVSFRVRSCPFFLSLILCFGGGVLLATSLLHMLSEVLLKLESAAPIYLCGGFLSLYIFDEISQYCLGGKKRKNQSSVAGNENNRRNELDSERTYESAGTSVTSSLVDSRSGKNYGSVMTKNLGKPSAHFSGKNDEEGLKTDSQQSLLDPYLCSETNFQPEHQYPANALSKSGLLLALFVHSVLEGISVGVQTTVSQMLMILGAVLFHKVVLAFCLGLELHHQGFRIIQLFIGIFLFSIGTPTGIFLGMIVTSRENKIFDVTSQLQAVAAGSLLYVAVIEVLPRERLKWRNDTRKAAGILQLIFLLIGFAIIAVLHFLVGHVN